MRHVGRPPDDRKLEISFGAGIQAKKMCDDREILSDEPSDQHEITACVG
jgi:hypothetical protein